MSDTPRERQAKAQKQKEDDWSWFMSTPAGRRIVHRDLLAPAELEADLFQGNSRDVYIEGRRSMARETLRNAKKSLDHYITMLKEMNND